jgi:phytoene/squalene synthetase
MGLDFKSLELYGTFTLGNLKLLRFRTDCAALHRLIPFFQDEERVYVCPGPMGYRLVTQTTEGKAPITVMQSAKLPGYKRTYHGTLHKFWQRQFSH